MGRKIIMSEINEDLLRIVKALSAKVEELEKAVYHKDNLLMKSGFVVANSPTPSMKVNPTEAGGVPDVSSMEWSDIHKMVKTMGGE